MSYLSWSILSSHLRIKLILRLWHCVWQEWSNSDDQTLRLKTSPGWLGKPLFPSWIPQFSCRTERGGCVSDGPRVFVWTENGITGKVQHIWYTPHHPVKKADFKGKTKLGWSVESPKSLEKKQHLFLNPH